jgi:hypothetical protein
MARSVDDEHLSLEILNCTAEALKSSVARRKVTETWGGSRRKLSLAHAACRRVRK